MITKPATMPVAFYDDHDNIMDVVDSPVLETRTEAGTPVYLIDKSLLDPEMVRKYRCRVIRQRYN